MCRRSPLRRRLCTIDDNLNLNLNLQTTTSICWAQSLSMKMSQYPLHPAVNGWKQLLLHLWLLRQPQRQPLVRRSPMTQLLPWIWRPLSTRKAYSPSVYLPPFIHFDEPSKEICQMPRRERDVGDPVFLRLATWPRQKWLQSNGELLKIFICWLLLYFQSTFFWHD